ncbi:aldehyde dehydrogenase family protein [Microbacterium sp. X-17]|uniref:aldehyde dehydrogenase family protein n=1 Tax=Microbacterium sp. X-17 TaxID=3144404 RepID=UPI0031F4DBF6
MTVRSVEVTSPVTLLKVGADYEEGQGERIAVENPATGEQIAEISAASAAQVERAVAAGKDALRRGEVGAPEERAAYLHALADLITERRDEFLSIVVDEVGTPISTARDLHISTPVEILHWLADRALVDRTEDLGANDGPGASRAIVEYRPIGVAAGITAYNYPVLFNAMKLGSALAAGCPLVLVGSPLAPLSSLLFASLLEEAGIPSRAASVLVGGVDTAKALIASQDVAKISFTGSVSSGEAVMAGAAAGLREVVLELGGKTAAILLPSADLGALTTALHHRYLRNAGQGCASPTRLLVPSDRLEEFAELSRTVYDRVPVGDPWDESTIVGPVITREHRARVHGYIDGAVADGGTVVASGHLPDEPGGWFVRPTLLGGLPNSARINQEEVFGPVASVLTYDTIDDAIDIANGTKYGLHASVFGDFEEARRVATRLEAGTVTINGGGRVRPDAPNGGWKSSGIGRERGELGVREYLEPVTVQWPA